MQHMLKKRQRQFYLALGGFFLAAGFMFLSQQGEITGAAIGLQEGESSSIGAILIAVSFLFFYQVYRDYEEQKAIFRSFRKWFQKEKGKPSESDLKDYFGRAEAEYDRTMDKKTISPQYRGKPLHFMIDYTAYSGRGKPLDKLYASPADVPKERYSPGNLAAERLEQGGAIDNYNEVVRIITGMGAVIRAGGSHDRIFMENKEGKLVFVDSLPHHRRLNAGTVNGILRTVSRFYEAN